MKVEVLQVKTVGKGFRFAHIRAGDNFGDVPAAEDVTGPGDAWLKSELRVKDGRIIAFLKVVKMPAQ